MIERLLLLGAVGDLATRHTLPALANLAADGALPPGLAVLGIGREPLDDETYRALAAARLEQHAPAVEAAARAALVRRLRYLQADLLEQPDLRAAVGEGPVVAYLALPPAAYAPAARALSAAGVAPGSRVVVEKPFGEDHASARELTALLHEGFAERDVFRVDHFLYHQAVQDLLALRFATPVFESLWNAEHVERVEITWEETAGVAARAGFYDGTGALRDMVQSHLLQLLALVAMEEPQAYDERALRDSKAAVLRSVPALGLQDVAARTARGRYTAGTVEGQVRRGYLEEPGVDATRGTETWVGLVLHVDAPRWRGVPFVLRTGKSLAAGRRRIDVHLRARPGGFLSAGPARLRMEMAPDRVTLDVHAAGAVGLPSVAPVRLEVARPPQSRPASARLLLDVLAGDPTLVVRDDEVEESWRIVDSVLAGWRAGAAPLQDYAAGSRRPRLPGDDGGGLTP